VVSALLDRHTLLSRPDYSGRDKPLAANLTQLLILLAPYPSPSEYLLDQYLVAAELVGVGSMILFNKVDLLDAEALVEFQTRFVHYRDLGYPSAWISLKDGRDLAPLARRFSGETSILVGQSGAGKSSLTRILLPDRQVQIGHLSEATGLGRHTTSAATCYRLPKRGRLIDSPGVRSFRLGAIGRSRLQLEFRELVVLRGQCRFNDCRHAQETGCAVKQALLVRSFALDFPASKIAELSNVSRPTINQLLLKLRIRVAQVCDASSPFSGEVKVDESYFGTRRVRGKKGRGAESSMCSPINVPFTPQGM